MTDEQLQMHYRQVQALRDFSKPGLKDNTFPAIIKHNMKWFSEFIHNPKLRKNKLVNYTEKVMRKIETLIKAETAAQNKWRYDRSDENEALFYKCQGHIEWWTIALRDIYGIQTPAEPELEITQEQMAAFEKALLSGDLFKL